MTFTLITKLLFKYLYKIKEKLFPDRKFRRARLWSNNELQKVASFFSGDVINVSGWQDSDKRSKKYKDYFINAKSYSISNYGGDMGFQNTKNEILLDLEKDLDQKYISRYDVVFNHTVLEHIFDVDKAFQNLCLMSKDVVIVVVPFMQEMHYGEAYKDYWRFTPFALTRMFEKNGMELIYLNANNKRNESSYVFAIGSRNPRMWEKKVNYVNREAFKDLGNKIIW